MKGKQTVRDMVLSMVAIGAVVAVIYVFLPRDESQDPLERKNYTVELATAQRATSYPVVAPEGLSDDWKATSVRFKAVDDQAWHLGFLSPEREYVGIEQSVATPRKFIDNVTHGAEETARTERIGGEDWKRYEGPKYDALVYEGDGYTTVVTGTAPFEDLTKVATSLKGPDPAK
ncbi:DUF4245 domain-containing protein [Streptomyces apocyni]|uniref:DUF4245 domain-containing protein n=1 Tax=Streptomyces apocyni TaxID=2654677 RepID=UPI0012EA6E12|nr:DUF4245 domain-containing protein [Streptomyces apocyni]